MTGHIPGTTVLRSSPKMATTARPGTNHVALRAANERLVLSLIRAHGQLSKAQIAELSGLTAQTASVIAHSLVDAGLLQVGAPVRGRVGQPSVPLSLNPDGATFMGVHVERGELQAALVNFTGQVIAERSSKSAALDLDKVIRFIASTADRMRPKDDPDRQARFQGIGVSFASGSLGQDRSDIPWEGVEADLSRIGDNLHVATYTSSDTVAACCAELIYGLGSGVPSFLYVFIDEAISGGLVREGRIQFARDDAGANLGRILVQGGDGQMLPLRRLTAETLQRSTATQSIAILSRGIAQAVTAAASVVPCHTVILDGAIDTDLLRKISIELRAALARIGTGEAIELSVREGSRHRKSIALGAACLPLADRFYPAETVGALSNG